MDRRFLVSTRNWKPKGRRLMLKRFVSVLFITGVLAAGVAAQEVEVDRYNINARIDTAASAVDAHAALSISNIGQSPKPKIYLRLTKLAKVSSATVNGAAAQVDTSEDRQVATLNQIVITPQTPIGPGARATVEVNYRIEAPESAASIYVYSGEVLLTPESLWFPMPS